MKTRLINKERIVESLDATLRDLEIRACWLGLKASELSYQEKINYITSFWNVSKEAVEKALYSDKAICH
tara:strand:- start:238 stop:444 length:207 start_codon:yes stop_codon:yes gene_type:complete